MRILITGGLGFIGSHLAKYYLDKGDEVIIVDNLSTGDINRLANKLHNSKLRILFLDVNTQSPRLNYESLTEEFQKGIDYVYHYSACVGVERTQNKPDLVLSDIMGITNIVTLCRQFNVKKFIFVSSSEVYGENETAIETEKNLCYNTPYMAVKRFGEMLCMETDMESVRPYVIRLFNVYGIGQSSNFLIGNIFNKIERNDKQFVVHHSNAKRDFVYIKDNIDATLAVVERGRPKEIYNICTGQGHYIGNVLGMASKITGYDFSVVYRKRDDIKIRGGNSVKLFKDTGFAFKYSLEDGLKDMWSEIND